MKTIVVFTSIWWTLKNSNSSHHESHEWWKDAAIKISWTNDKGHCKRVSAEALDEAEKQKNNLKKYS